MAPPEPDDGVWWDEPNSTIKHSTGGNRVKNFKLRDHAKLDVGDKHYYKVYPPRAPKLEDGFSNVPLQKATYYIGRATLQASLKAQLHDTLEVDAKRSTVVVISGLGGTGKTQLVLDYIETYRDDYCGIFWLNAGDRQAVERELGVIFRVLYKIPGSTDSEIPPLDQILVRIKNWFSRQRGKWLWVFDSADNVEDREDAGYVDLIALMPTIPSVQVIVTSRSANVRKVTRSKPVVVGSLEQHEALRLFWQTCEQDEAVVSAQNRDTAILIVMELDCLALAVQLAGKTVSESRTLAKNLSLYLSEYHENKQKLLETKPDWLVTQYGGSLLTAWETTFTYLRKRSSTAVTLLGFLTILDPTDIFLGLFEVALSSAKKESRTSSDNEQDWNWQTALSHERAVDVRLIEDAFTALESFSFVQYVEKGEHYTMHKLVQDWGYQRLSQDDQLATCRAVTNLLVDVVVQCDPEPAVKSRLLKHITKCFEFSSTASQYTTERDSLSFLERFLNLESFTDSIGSWNESEKIKRFHWRTLDKIVGQEHLNTITAMSNLAITLRDQGMLDEAASMTKQVLEKMKRILGDEHPNTISAMSNLATTLRDQGRLDEAAEMMKQVLEMRRRILGDEHPDTISAMNNLASTIRDQGRFDEAASMTKQVLEKMKRILGDEHPNTISAMSNLATTLRDQGRLDEAAEMMKQVLEKMRRILGDEHPDTISAMGNLANTLGDQGRLDEAASMKKEVLEKMKRILGDDHPNTISAMGNLANTLGDQGRLDEAASMKKEVLEKMKRILGDDHPNTISAMNNLANTLGDQGRLDEAASMMKQVLEKMRRIFGNEHPGTTWATRNLIVLEQRRMLHPS